MNWHKNEFTISDDKNMLNKHYIQDYLANKSYWAENIPEAIVRKSIEGSFCFGIYCNEKQVGFARVITDKATFGYLADVFVDEGFRGRGLAKYAIEFADGLCGSLERISEQRPEFHAASA